MPIENLYTLDTFLDEPENVSATITIDAAHPIFKGHFPGQPVLPGVCQLQIVKELLEKALNKNLFLQEAASCKFLQMIDPTQTSRLNIVIDHHLVDNTISCHAVIKGGEQVFLKMNGVFKMMP